MKNYKKYLFIVVLFFGFQLFSQNSVVVENTKLTVTNLGGSNYTVGTNAELRITTPTIANGTVNLTSDSGWLILDGILPSVAIASHLNYITLNGQPAVNKVNIRVTNFLQGCVIIPHTPIFEALTLYKEPSFAGDEMKCIPLKYYKTIELGGFDNTVSSFKLKKGYMATFAQNENGSGFSKVYIAENDDIEISILPNSLNNLVSFVRVFPWRYTAKKGFGAGFVDFNRSIKFVELTKSSWFYNWGVPSSEDLTDYEFVPMKSYANSLTDPKWQEINTINYSSHILGYNEPNNPGQLNMTVAEQLKYWPKLMESGMRLGSPAPTNWTEFYEFMDKCDELNYRVDFVAIHDYGEGTAEAFYKNCKRVHDRTGRPIWVTEFNWGGTWTVATPTYTQTSSRIAEIIDRYDKEGIIERYAIFNFSEVVNRYGGVQNRAVFYTPAIPDYLITPIGEVYRDNVSPTAFNASKQIDLSFKLVAPQNISISNGDGLTNILKWDKSYTEFGTIIIERAFGSGSYTQIAQLSSTSSNYNDDVTALGFGLYNYRFLTRQAGFADSKTVTKGFDLSPNTIFNVALTKPAIASSTLSSSLSASNAVDGNTTLESSRWVNTRGLVPATLEIDLQASFLISQIKLFTGLATSNNPITRFTFDYWDEDTQSWKTAVTETNNLSTAYSKSFTEVKTNKVRLTVGAAAPDNTVRLFEIEVYGRIATLGTNDLFASKFNIYPNPAADRLNITGNAAIELLQIFDMNGKQLIIQKNSNTVDVSALPTGVYFVKFNNKETIKFIKK